MDFQLPLQLKRRHDPHMPEWRNGRRDGLKIHCPLKTCRFDPGLGHSRSSALAGLLFVLRGHCSLICCYRIPGGLKPCCLGRKHQNACSALSRSPPGALRRAFPLSSVLSNFRAFFRVFHEKKDFSAKIPRFFARLAHFQKGLLVQCTFCRSQRTRQRGFCFHDVNEVIMRKSFLF